MSQTLSRLNPLSAFGRPCTLDRVNGPVRGGTMLAKDIGPLVDAVSDPKKLGTHGARDERKAGEIYTHLAGFIDIGHVRNMADSTKNVFDALVASDGQPTQVRTRHGKFELTQRLPKDRRLWADVALRAAYEDGLGYEILTYGVRFLGRPVGFGMLPSAFSPEDLTSNYLGAYLAREIILKGGDFNTQFTRALSTALASLGAVSPDETRKTLEQIKGRWMSRLEGLGVLTCPDSLLRRDFDRKPRRVGKDALIAPPPWLTRPLPDVGHLYRYENTWMARLPREEWPALLGEIRKDAFARYGEGYDDPSP